MTPPFLAVAQSLALDAGRRLMELSQAPLVRERKADHSLVTNADQEADRILRAGLRRAFPDHASLTEESGLEGSAGSEYAWIVDPLDGTKAYAKGIAGFSVMVGLLKDGIPCLGVVVDPLEGIAYSAVKGEGAFCRRGDIQESARVSARTDLSVMPVVTSTGFPDGLERSLRQRLCGPWLPAVNSVGVKVGRVIRQQADIYINHHTVHYWDTCAPQVLLEEAGGIMTFWNGRSLRYSLAGGDYRHEGPTLATNNGRHPEILALLQAVSVKPPRV